MQMTASLHLDLRNRPIVNTSSAYLNYHSMLQANMLY